MALVSNALRGVRVAVPESRQLDILTQLLEKRGAQVKRIPLVSIYDNPDEATTISWLKRFIESPPDLFIILTGEGVRRLYDLAERHDLKAALTKALSKTTLLCRGPKPLRALREHGQKTVVQAKAPTTVGVIDTLSEIKMDNFRVAVQLYGEDPNLKLIQYLKSRQVNIDTVAPYIYADESEETEVLALIQALQNKELDVIAFTSQPQFKRLVQVAKKTGILPEMLESLNHCCVAAIGPVVKAQLEESGVNVKVIPKKAYFMKPLVTEIVRYFSK